MELLARLAPAVSKWDTTPTGKPELSQSDIAAACAELTPDQYHIVMVKWAGHNLNSTFINMLWFTVADYASEKRWKIPRGREYLRKMVKLALWEVVGHHRCPTCRGTKGFAHVVCPACEGRGVLHPTDADRAFAIGMDESRWTRVWKARYESVYRLLRGMEMEGISKIKQQLAEPS